VTKLASAAGGTLPDAEGSAAGLFLPDHMVPLSSRDEAGRDPPFWFKAKEIQTPEILVVTSLVAVPISYLPQPPLPLLGKEGN